jgi:hypothetical protein
VDGSAPSETKETAHRVRAVDVGTLTTLRSFASTDCKQRMMVIQLDQLVPYEGATLTALRREQREQLESNHHENRATGRKMRPSTDAYRPFGTNSL